MASTSRTTRTRPSGRTPSPARQPKQKARSRSLVRRLVRWCVIAGILGGAAATAVLAAAYSELEIPATPPPLQTTQVLDVHGDVIGSYHATIDRTVIPFSDMPVHLREAVLATEDANFYEHRGIDPFGILRALWADIRAGSAVQGGSTITQQLVKSVYAGHYEDDPETGERVYVVPERSVLEKVREALLAIKLERELTKDEILRRYLNTIYFGHGAYGVEAAAQTYWRKPARNLTVLQAATLAAVIQSPSSFDPALNPEDARVRRDWVLGRMVDTGALDEAEAQAMLGRPVKTNPAPDSGFAPRLGYFLDYTRQGLMDRYGEGQVYGGGMRITTTLDLAWQRAAEGAVAHWLPNATDPEAALVAIDPQTGAIRAMVGGRDFGVSRVNLATGQGGSGRQAGSAFKVFTLAAAVEDGYALSSVWNGPAKITIPDEACYTDGKPWTLSNASDEEAGVFTLRQATAHSVNTVYAQLVTRVGPQQVVDVAHRLGIRSELAPYCAITLGTEAVNPLEMTSAYATLAAGAGDGRERRRPRDVRAPERPRRGHGVPRADRASRGGQDRYRAGLRRRVVLRLHAAARDLRVGRLPRCGAVAHEHRGIPGALRGDDPSAHLAGVHGRGDDGSARRGLPEAVVRRVHARSGVAVADGVPLDLADPDHESVRPADTEHHGVAVADRDAEPGLAEPGAVTLAFADPFAHRRPGRGGSLPDDEGSPPPVAHVANFRG